MTHRDRASLDAHRINAGPSSFVRIQLARAQRWRRGPLAWIAPGWRTYLNVLIGLLEKELGARDRG
jgi:hypothetical protein